MEMPTNEWMLCSVKKLFFETGKQHDLNMCIQIYHINEFLFADDLKKAENKLKQCQYSSDIASEIEQLPEKRQWNKPNRYIVTRSSDQYSISDCYCMINDQIIEIHNFLRNNDIILILGRKFCTYEFLYTYLFTSKNLKVFVIDIKLHDDLECWKLSHIDSKCFVFPFNNKHVSFPLLHT